MKPGISISTHGHLQLKRKFAWLVAAAAFASLAACTTSGLGSGELERAGQAAGPVTFAWQSQDGGISGTMHATVNGASYQGRFFEITQQTDQQSLGPLWGGWNEGWGDWPYGGWGFDDGFDGGNWSDFVTHYSGKVLANLSSPAGDAMRCRFELASPSQGMSGGGSGECQMQDKSVVDANFPPS